MVPIKDSKGSVPVFVFLDENVSCAKFEKLKSVNVPRKYKLKIIPFPMVMDCLGVFDFQVVLFLKKMVTSRYYGFRQTLFCRFKPFFLFVTRDKTFLQDAEKGFESWKGDKKRKHQNKDVILYRDPLNPTKDAILIKLDNDHVANIHLRYIKGGPNDNQSIIIGKIKESLENFLN